MSTKKDVKPVQPNLNLDSDMYLSLAVELYEKGTWSKDLLIKRVTLYAESKNIDMDAINAFLERLTKEKEYTIEEKRNFLSVLRLDGKELKYGDVVETMSDEMIEKFYEMEVSFMESDKVESYHDLANFKSNINAPQEEKTDDIFVDEKQIENNKTAQDEETKTNGFHAPDPIETSVVPEKPEIKAAAVPETSNISVTKEKEEDSHLEQVSEASVVVPEINFSAEANIPETEEEFEEQAHNIKNPEKESTVRKINVSPERLEKLKKSKYKVINFFLKTAIVVVALELLNPVSAVTSIGGYLLFASQIRNGEFNPKNPVGKAVKKVVETIMNIGIPNKEIEKGGKTR